MESENGNTKASHDSEILGYQSRSIKNWHLLTEEQREEISNSLKHNTPKVNERPRILRPLSFDEDKDTVKKNTQQNYRSRQHTRESVRHRRREIHPSGTLLDIKSLKNPKFLLSLSAAAVILFSSPKLLLQEKQFISPVPQNVEQQQKTVVEIKNQQKVTSKKEPPVANNQEKNQPTKEDYRRAIEEGFTNWGKDMPMAKYSSVMAEAPLKYPIFKKYPFLLPAVSIMETSGGKNVHHLNNPLSWGIKALLDGVYTPSSWEQNIRDAMSGIGGRELENDFENKYMPSQISTSRKYEDFRKSKNLLDFANVYAPLEDNPETGGPYYAQSLKEIMDVFESKLPKGNK